MFSEYELNSTQISLYEHNLFNIIRSKCRFEFHCKISNVLNLLGSSAETGAAISNNQEQPSYSRSHFNTLSPSRGSIHSLFIFHIPV